MYNQYAAGRQPLTTEIISFDRYNGHPNQNDQYHYHFEPLWLTAAGKSAFLGVLLDGERHHERPGLVGVVGDAAAVQIGGQRDEALAGESFADIGDVVVETPPLLDDDHPGPRRVEGRSAQDPAAGRGRAARRGIGGHRGRCPPGTDGRAEA